MRSYNVASFLYMGKNNIDKILKKIVNSELGQVEKDYNKVINDVNRELQKDVSKMYDSFIDSFYKYKTSSYVRHYETKPGTMMGLNLYQANEIRASKYSPNPKIIININADDMIDNNYGDSANSVLDYVMSGVRYGNDRYNIYNYWKTPSYHGKYVQITNPNNIYGAFYQLEHNFLDISRAAFYPKWEKLYS